VPASVSGQGLPTSQPNFLTIIREEVKPGRQADHAKIEAGWPAAFEKANSPNFYLGVESMTGTGEAWFLIPFESHAAEADAMKREGEPALAAELERLSRADSEMLNGWRNIRTRARKDLSHGAYPTLAQQRFFEVTIFRLRPGKEAEFAAAAKAYGAAVARSGQGVSFRVYEVMAGMPGPAFLVFSSVTSYAEFDKMMAADEAIMKAFTPEDGQTFQKYSEGAINTETHRFRLSPAMSYVPKDVRAQDPAFWMPKK
jgi:hypothetical protein